MATHSGADNEEWDIYDGSGPVYTGEHILTTKDDRDLRTMKMIFVFLLIVSAAACSNKQVYTAIQQNQRFECSKLPQAQSEDCMRQFDISYEQYQEDRKSAAKDPR